MAFLIAGRGEVPKPHLGECGCLGWLQLMFDSELHWYVPGPGTGLGLLASRRGVAEYFGPVVPTDLTPSLWYCPGPGFVERGVVRCVWLRVLVPKAAAVETLLTSCGSYCPGPGTSLLCPRILGDLPKLALGDVAYLSLCEGAFT